jgi:hypothetical protein
MNGAGKLWMWIRGFRRNRHICAIARRPKRNCEPYSARSTGDEHCFAAKTDHFAPIHFSRIKG